MSAPAGIAVASSQTIAPPRERILTVARELFYQRGIHAIGVDAIAEAAGTNKMTLYRHFASKDELVAACLRAFASEIETEWHAIAADHVGDPHGQLRAWLRHIGSWFAREGGRGCALANAAIELPDPDHPARRVIKQAKSDALQRLADLCREAGMNDPQALAEECFLLCEGARVTTQSLGSDEPLKRLPALLDDLMAEHTPPERSPAGRVG